MNNNEQIQEYIDEMKNSLLSLYNEVDAWFDSYKKLLSIVHIEVDLNGLNTLLVFLKEKTIELYNLILQTESVIDEAIAKTWLIRLMDIEDALDALKNQTKNVEEASSDVAEGLIPTGVNLKIPSSWRELRSSVGR